MSDLGRVLVILGLVILVTGILLLVGGRIFPWLGRLPGDIRYEGENFKLFIPITTMILISVVGTIILNIIIRIFRR
jgi:hypothetical protein